MYEWLESIKGSIDDAVFKKAEYEEEQGRDSADFLLVSGYLSRNELLLSLSDFHDMPSILLDQYEPQDEALQTITEDVARRFSIVPLFIIKDMLYLATDNPDALMIEDYIRQLTGLTVEELITTKKSIEDAINRRYLLTKRTAEKVETIASLQEKKTIEDKMASDLQITDTEAPSIKMVNHILSSAIRLGASDIHLEPFEDSVSLRYRIDGILREYPAPPYDMIKAVTSRIKIISDLDVSEKRLPQDGRSTFDLENRDYDLRVSIIPNLFGESVVIRVLDSGSGAKSLKDLGFNETLFNQYTKLINKPYGIILVTGPTGSGKSTTLYATLRHIYTPEKKIITLEDPVEAQVKGITQFQMNSQIGFTFARALRSVLRHDPEIILIGEIRDLETAEIAMRASLTGHLLFSTLHTNDAPSAATRLIDMGVPGYLVMTSVVGVLAQRLVRKLCPRCKEEFIPGEKELISLDLQSIPHESKTFKPVGCSHCENIGYKGRSAIYELMEITPEMRRIPAEKITSEKLREIAEQHQFISLRQSALEKLFDGITSMEEVVKLTVE